MRWTLTMLLHGVKVEQLTLRIAKCCVKLIIVQKEINKANALFKHIAILVPAVAKSFHANADGLKKKKSQQVTMAIRNAGLSADIKAITLNKLTAKRKVKCLEIPHYA